MTARDVIADTYVPSWDHRVMGAGADAIVAALTAAGYAIVPVELMDEQYTAAMQFALDHMAKHNVTGLSPFSDYPPLQETTAGMYRAMITAAQAEQEKRG